MNERVTLFQCVGAVVVLGATRFFPSRFDLKLELIP
jgi:hypothetical protein